MKTTTAALSAGLVAVGIASPVQAKPPGPVGFCAVYPDAPACAAAAPDCRLCHVPAGPPGRNVYGRCIEDVLLVGDPRPLSDVDFSAGLVEALQSVEELDCDGDGFSNVEEIFAGTLPGDAADAPEQGDCPGLPNPDYAVCEYDPAYAFKKISLDFCGRSPTWSELQEFLSVDDDDQGDALHDLLDACLDSEFWIGKDGEVWSLAHRKVRPVQSLKGGLEDPGSLPVLGDYYDDYQLFVYTQIDDNDARDVMLADYYVVRGDAPTTYTPIADKCATACGLDLACIFDCATGDQLVPTERRAGLLTTRWTLMMNTMFSAMPRTTAAQAYRAFLGLDIAKMEGLEPIAGEPVDYDNKGVDRQECATCHSTLDPLSYPFTTYNGFSSTEMGLFTDAATYVPDRMARFGYPATPEQGYLFGEPVDDLLDWADVAANSDAFAVSTVSDYWRLAMNGEPTDSTREDFDTLWQRFRGPHDYRVERMLHDLIDTEAYGAP